MNPNTKSNIIYASKILIPIVIVIGLFLGGVSAGIITFESPDKLVITREISASIVIDFRDGTTYSKVLTLNNSTVFDFLLEIEKIGDISIETTYWESFGGYSVDSIKYEGKKYEADISTYWALYINGQPAIEGADKIYVQNDDLIEWKFEKF
jgi:hypothetical protein